MRRLHESCGNQGGREGWDGREEEGEETYFFFFKVQGLGCFAHVRKGGKRTPMLSLIPGHAHVLGDVFA